MEAARWQRLNELFHDAVGRRSDERAAWIEGACDGDQTLRVEVERLVRAHDRASGVIGANASPNALQFLADPDAAVRLFAGTDRFTVRRLLGVGGMGVVYEVHDRIRDEIVALKTLLRADPAEIYRLKREFRTLADVAHVNLVSLYELFVESDGCFFTMELVDGATFVEAARADLQRLPRLFEQLVHGVSELHQRGKFHRDIKPSNVLVTRDDRVVILDFGLIAELSSRSGGQRERIAGTPAYMAPEQAAGAPPSEAADWYSVGVTLYEALTGRVPFSGTLDQLVSAKQDIDPPAPASLLPGIQQTLSDVCMALLSRDPQRRLTGVDALQRLGGGASISTTIARGHETPFVGREWQLNVLREAFEGVQAGRAAAVYVCGPSGIGKSALVDCFLDRMLAREPAIVLSGRCYENESVPYKALDGVVDSLSHYLTSLPAASVEALMPADIATLARLFPVLMGVDAVASAPRPQQDSDPLLVRSRALTALRELLTRLGGLEPVVIAIDDLHWADADSAVLLEELLRPPGAPPLLMLACFRTEEMPAKPFLRALLQGSGGAAPLPLAPMSDEEARELIGALLPADSDASRDEMLQIAREAEGSPFFVEQLARYVAVHRAATRDEPTLAEMLDDRLRRLPSEARVFLDTLVICGRPMAPSLVRQAADLTADERSLLAILRSAHFVRSSGSGERVEIYHDRIRSALAAHMDPEHVQRVHASMARTLVARQIDDPEALFEHYRAAGDREHASHQAGLAGEKASTVLAFDRAALFFRQALELSSDVARHPGWKKGLGEALANAGRTADAATVYAEAAQTATGSERLELQRRAAHQFLVGGHIDRGIDVLRAVLDAAGMRFPRTTRAALLSLWLERARLRWRGLRFVERREDQVPRDVLLRIDTCWSVMSGMGMVDNVPAYDFHTRQLRLALDAGEPYRLARAFAAESAFRTARGDSGPQTASFARLGEELSQRSRHPHAIAFSTLTVGLSALFRGEWKQATVRCEKALRLLRETCVGVTWEVSSAESFFIGSLLYQGEVVRVARELEKTLAIARERGNLYLEAELRTRFLNLVLLAADDPDGAERQATEVMARWWQGGFTRQHYNHMLARATTALYRGDGHAAWRIVAENSGAASRALLTHLQLVRVEMSYLRGRCALAAASAPESPGTTPSRGTLLSLTRREARRLAREQMPWSAGFSLLLGAGVASLAGDMRTAEQQLAHAVRALERADMNLYAAVARRRLGMLQGDRGRGLVCEAEDWMASQAVRNPRFMSRMIAPGFRDE